MEKEFNKKVKAIFKAWEDDPNKTPEEKSRGIAEGVNFLYSEINQGAVLSPFSPVEEMKIELTDNYGFKA